MVVSVGFEIPTEPVAASRPRVTARGIAYYPKKHTSYQEYLKHHLKDVPAMDSIGAVEVKFLFVMPSYKTSDHPVHRTDVDNLSKLPMDVMTKIQNGDGPKFWVDDCFVVHLTSLKRFAREGEVPHTKVKITLIEGSVEDHIDKVFNND
jgi:Holliday junction resolvase RusA-like endonuclease